MESLSVLLYTCFGVFGYVFFKVRLYSFWASKDRDCCLVTKSCLTLCNPMDGSMPGLPVLHYLPEFAQTHVCWVGDAIQPSHPLSSSSPAFNLSQHQGLFQWVSFSHQVVKSIGASTSASILPMNIQGWFGIANHFSILTVRAPQTVWKGKKIGIILRRASHTIYMTRWEQLQIGFMQKKIQKNRFFFQFINWFHAEKN